MSEGASGQFIVKNQAIESFVATYQRVLLELGFKVEESTWGAETFKHKAVLGDKSKAFTVSHFAAADELTESGNRYGAEADISKWNGEIMFKVRVIPYMTLIDHKDEAVLTQGALEMSMDEKRCLEMLRYMINGLVYYGAEIYVYDPAMMPPHTPTTAPQMPAVTAINYNH